MAIRKSIRDIQTSSTIDEISSMETVKKNTVKIQKIDKSIEPTQEIPQSDFQRESDIVMKSPISQIPQLISNTKKQIPIYTVYNNTVKFLSKIKPIYLIFLGMIFIGLILLIFIPSNIQKDPTEQNKKEAEFVKNQFAKHIVLPENEQIDIRKITNKMEDLFFKDAEVGDYLIIFYKNRIAYIYSINRDIIVNAGVVFIDPKTATTTNSMIKTQ